MVPGSLDWALDYIAGRYNVGRINPACVHEYYRFLRLFGDAGSDYPLSCGLRGNFVQGICRQGSAYLLRIIMGQVGFGDMVVRLYSFPRVPQRSDTMASFVEPTDPTYAPVVVTPSEWEIDDSGDFPVAYVSPALEFTFTNPVSLYGYYVSDPTSTVLLWSQTFDQYPSNVPVGGGVFSVSPWLRLK